MKHLLLLVFLLGCKSIQSPTAFTISNDVPGWTFQYAAVWDEELYSYFLESTYRWEAVVIHAVGMIPRTVVKKAEGVCYSNSLPLRHPDSGAYQAAPLSRCSCEEYDLNKGYLDEALQARRSLDKLTF